MRKSVSWVMTAILIGCLVAPASVFAARIDPEPREFRNSSPEGIASFTHDEKGFVFTFESRSGRTIKMFGDKRTATLTIEGFAIHTTPGHVTVSYRGQVVDAAVDSDGATISEADAAAVAYLAGVWRDETGIGPDLALAQIALKRAQVSQRAHPRALDGPCGHAEEQLAQDAVGILGSTGCGPCMAVTIGLFLIDLVTATMDCGWGNGYECDSCGIG